MDSNCYHSGFIILMLVLFYYFPLVQYGLLTVMKIACSFWTIIFQHRISTINHLWPHGEQSRCTEPFPTSMRYWLCADLGHSRFSCDTPSRDIQPNPPAIFEHVECFLPDKAARGPTTCFTRSHTCCWQTGRNRLLYSQFFDNVGNFSKTQLCLRCSRYGILPLRVTEKDFGL